MSERMMAEQTCRGCGCTDARACMTQDGPCWWVGEDLCSACADALHTLPALAGDGADTSLREAAQACPDSPAGAPHAPLWLDEHTGYCARCGLGFEA